MRPLKHERYKVSGSQESEKGDGGLVRQMRHAKTGALVAALLVYG